jgi:glycosyltransferase involved in cell wall biosynthesis
LKLAILGSRGIPASYGGFETFAEELAIRLVKEGIEVVVYCEADRARTNETYKGVSLRYVPKRRIGGLSTIIFDLQCLWQVRKSADVVYMLGYGAALFCFLPRVWNRVVWINMDGVEWRRSKWGPIARLWLRLMERCALSSANRIICDAEAIRDHISERHRKTVPTSVIPYGAVIQGRMPEESLSKWKLAPRDYYLLVCRLEPENHVKEIVEGFCESNTSRSLVVVGDVDASNRYAKALADRANNRVLFIGGIYDRDELAALRYHCRAYFHGHSVGGTNPSLLEAMAVGNVVVAHDNVFNREVAAHNAYYFCDQRDIPPIVALVESFSDADLDRTRQAGHTRVQDRYQWEHVVAQYLRLLRTTPTRSEQTVGFQPPP